MSFTYENQGTHTYLVYTIQEQDAIDAMSLGMLTNNKITGLAQAMFTQMDTTKYIKYDVSAKVSARQFFTGPVNKKRLLGVFNGIVDAMLAAEDYMIDISSMLVDLDYIFADVTTCETVLVCLPIENDGANPMDLGAFFKNIMFTTQFDPSENCDHVAKIINYLNSAPIFSLEDFKKVLDGISGAPVPAAVPQPQPQVQPQVPYHAQPQVQPQQPVAPQRTPVQQNPMHTAMPQSNPVQQAPSRQAPAQPAAQKPAQPPVPGPANPFAQQAKPAQPQSAPEKKITLLDLLSHYSAENAALYKAQKAAKGNGQSAPAAAQPAKASKSAGKPAQMGFAIPGQEAPPIKQGFAIPGQQPAPVQPVAAKAPVQPVQTQRPQPQMPVAAPVNPAPVFAAPMAPQGKPMNFGETTVLGGGAVGETTVLGAAPVAQLRPHLIRTKNNEKINLDKPVFRIGKEKSYVDYFIGDNSAISRSHANIITRDGEYFVVDTNSTNHTYVNGVMIQSNVETAITHGAKIKLANEDFEFRLY